MKRIGFLLTILVCPLILSCRKKIEVEKLYGEWRYVKVESLSNADENTTDEELAENSPSIKFYKNEELIIIWGNEVLSTGKFKIEGEIIRYVETLPGGATRPILFLVKKLTPRELVFETMKQEVIRVTARKLNSAL
jgi:hypothetical protein